MCIYGISGLRIKKIKDNYKNKKEMYKEVGVFAFYDYFEKLDRFNKNFNIIVFMVSYTLILFSITFLEGIGEFFMLYSLFTILIALIEKIIYYRLRSIKTEDVYENGYFVNGYAVKNNLRGIIEFTTFHIDTLHLELEKELKILFD